MRAACYRHSATSVTCIHLSHKRIMRDKNGVDKFEEKSLARLVHCDIKIIQPMSVEI